MTLLDEERTHGYRESFEKKRLFWQSVDVQLEAKTATFDQDDPNYMALRNENALHRTRVRERLVYLAELEDAFTAAYPAGDAA